MSEVSLVDGHIDNGISDAETVGILNEIVHLYHKDKTTIKGIPLITFLGDILDLINRQKAEIETLNSRKKPTVTGGYKIENGKVIFYSDMLNGYRHEYKDLEEIVKELNLYMHTDYKNIELISHYKHKAQTDKTEAIKEFAGRLKSAEYYTETGVYCLDDDDIDNLVKEMTESK